MYRQEFGRHWQALLAASIGLGLGSALSHYTTSLFGPPLLAEFGWSRADFALLGSVPIVSFLLIPFAGRFVDRFGTRIAAITGYTALPVGYLAFAMMSGSLVEFFAIYVLQHIFGMLTTSMVFCRIVVERFDGARGIALSLVMTAPPLAGAIAPFFLGDIIQAEGWRTAYFTLAGITAAGGLIAIATMSRAGGGVPAAPREHRKLGWAELGSLLRHPTLLLILGGMFLVNIPQVVAGSQLMLVVMANGITTEAATFMVSLYAVGVIVGRFASGLALDRISPHKVALATLGLPALGYVVLASSSTPVGLVGVAIALIGLAQGAESDIGAFLISRRFDMRNFSMLLSLVTSMIAAGSIVGSFILSASLRGDGSYQMFMLVSAVATLLGAGLFALTGSRRARAGTPDAVADKVVEQAMTGEVA